VWADALLALRLFADDPHGFGGVVVRAGPGPVRDAWLERLRSALGPGRAICRMPPGIADDALLGGLDLPATLAAGRPVRQAGLLARAEGGVIVVPMAERLEPATAARLAAALDTGRAGPGGTPARFGLVLLDEGQGDEGVPTALADRLAFRIALDNIPPHLAAAPDPDLSVAEPGAAAGEDPVATLCALADAFGIASPRASILALRVARALAPEDAGRAILNAARLVLAPRAERLPEAAPPPEPPQEGEAQQPSPADDGSDLPATPEDQVLDAVRAAIPPHLLDALLAGGPRRSEAKAGRGGKPEAVSRTGRPVGSRPGDPRRHRLDLLATLRAAAPWQGLRRSADPAGAAQGGLRIRRDDLRIRRLRRRVETTTVFCVDASGSAARERLAEAKGAVESLLAEAYIRRDRVALVAFRGRGADLVLPPTRSLTRAKRGLAGLPGGGGTPLAAGLDAALSVAATVRRGGGNPVVVVLTDGRANVARSGEGGRARAGDEALQAARAIRQAGLPVLVVDTGARGGGARTLAEAMAARYLALPRSDGSAIGAAAKALR